MSNKNLTQRGTGATGALGRALHALIPTGVAGFEGFVARLLSEETGVPFRVAASGLQCGLDLASEIGAPCSIAVECKRFGESTPISERALSAEISTATSTRAGLDLWILATSRSVTTQEDQAIARLCNERGIDYLTLDCGTESEPGALDALCARRPAAVLELLYARLGRAHDLVKQAEVHLASLAQHSAVDVLARRTSERLHANSVGFRTFRTRLNDELRDAMSDMVRSRVRFNQPLNVAEVKRDAGLVERKGVKAQLAAAWQRPPEASPSFVVVQGEEGDGKSWVVADWALEQLDTDDAPAIFFIRAQDHVDADGLQALVDHAARRAPVVVGADYALKLRRWKSGGERRFLVVFDGINERHDPALWAPVIQAVSGELGAAGLVLVTCRTDTWRTSYEGSRIWMKPVVCTVGPYDDQEFASAIAHLDLADRQRLIGLGKLVRKPRYLACAIRHLARLTDAQDLTIARLYYEDWRDRLQDRPSLPLDSDEFEALIRDHARRWLQSQDSRTDANHPWSQGDQRQLLEELSTGGVLRRDRSGAHRVQAPYLVLGLGLLLADGARDRKGDASAKEQYVEAQLGGNETWDLTADICEQAVLCSMGDADGTGSATLVALLSVWTRCQNAADRAIDRLPTYAAQRPDVICELAEQLWNRLDTTSNVERAVLDGLTRVATSETDGQQLLPTFSRWLGYVHEYAEYGRPTEGEHEPRLGTEVRRLIAEAPGTRQFGAPAVTLTRLVEQRPLRLGRLALAAISEASRRLYWPALVAGQIGNEAMNGCRSQLIAWLIRSSREPLLDLATRTIQELRRNGDLVCMRAARRLVQYLGAAELLPELDSLPASLFPPDPIRTQHSDDPCLSLFFAPDRDQVPRCLRRPDVPPHIKRNLAMKFVADPTFEFPSEFIASLNEGAPPFPMNRLRQTMGSNADDLVWEELEYLLCRFNPSLYAQKVREFATTVTERQGVALRQFALTIHRYALLLTDVEIRLLRAKWEALLQVASPWSQDQTTTEAFLFLTLLPVLSPWDQLECLLRRPDEAHDLVRITPMLSAWPAGSADVLIQRSLESEVHRRRILWLMTAQREIDEQKWLPVAQQGLNSTDSITRGLAMALLRRMSEGAQQRMFGTGAWSASRHMSGVEYYNGTLLALETASVGDAEVVHRCDRAMLGVAIGRLSPERQPAVARAYGELLLQTAHSLIDAGAPVPVHPDVDISSGPPHAPWIQRGLANEGEEHETFRAELSTWGGLDPMPAAGLFQRMSDEAREGRQRALLSAFDEALERGNWLLALSITTESALAILEAIPDFVGRLKALTHMAAIRDRIGLLTALLDAFACACLRRGDAEGWTLLELRESTMSPVRFTDSLTGLKSTDAAIFASPQSTRSEDAWRARLERARSDKELLAFANAMVIGGNRGWVVQTATADAKSTSPYHRARALVLQAALDDDSFDAVTSQCQVNETWYEGLGIWLREHRLRREAMDHWLDALLAAESPEQCMAAAQLLQHCADVRFRSFLELRRSALAPQDQVTFDQRMAWLDQDKLNREFTKVDKQLDQRLLGQRTLMHDAAPWLDD